MTTTLSPTAARRVFLTLTVTRWFPVGLVMGLFTLLALERGLSIAEITAYAAASGIAVVLLELPTSGVADAIGRRPVLLLAGVVNVITGLLYLRAHTFGDFVVAAAAMGIYRALDSGPLDAWFVDTVHATDPDADVSKPLSLQGGFLSGAICVGAVLSGVLIAWHPLTGRSALELPLLCYIGLNAGHLLLTAALVKENRARDGSEGRVLAHVRRTPAIVADALRLVRSSRILTALVAVEIFWVTAMAVFETFQPIRLTELLGSETRAGEINAPLAAVAWGFSAIGSLLIMRVADRIGVVRSAIWCRLLNGIGAAVMGLMTGVPGLVAAYLLTYAVHGAAAPMHMSLLHREASAENRATVLSMNSMVMFLAGSVIGPLLGLLATTTSTQVAMVVAGLVSTLGILCYRPALRRERAEAAERSSLDPTPPR